MGHLHFRGICAFGVSVLCFPNTSHSSHRPGDNAPPANHAPYPSACPHPNTGRCLPVTPAASHAHGRHKQPRGPPGRRPRSGTAASASASGVPRSSVAGPTAVWPSPAASQPCPRPPGPVGSQVAGLSCQGRCFRWSTLLGHRPVPLPTVPRDGCPTGVPDGPKSHVSSTPLGTRWGPGGTRLAPRGLRAATRSRSEASASGRPSRVRSRIPHAFRPLPQRLQLQGPSVCPLQASSPALQKGVSVASLQKKAPGIFFGGCPSSSLDEKAVRKLIGWTSCPHPPFARKADAGRGKTQPTIPTRSPDAAVPSGSVPRGPHPRGDARGTGGRPGDASPGFPAQSSEPCP